MFNLSDLAYMAVGFARDNITRDKISATAAKASQAFSPSPPKVYGMVVNLKAKTVTYSHYDKDSKKTTTEVTELTDDVLSNVCAVAYAAEANHTVDLKTHHKLTHAGTYLLPTTWKKAFRIESEDQRRIYRLRFWPAVFRVSDSCLQIVDGSQKTENIEATHYRMDLPHIRAVKKHTFPIGAEEVHFDASTGKASFQPASTNELVLDRFELHTHRRKAPINVIETVKEPTPSTTVGKAWAKFTENGRKRNPKPPKMQTVEHTIDVGHIEVDLLNEKMSFIKGGKRYIYPLTDSWREIILAQLFAASTAPSDDHIWQLASTQMLSYLGSYNDPSIGLAPFTIRFKQHLVRTSENCIKMRARKGYQFETANVEGSTLTQTHESYVSHPKKVYFDPQTQKATIRDCEQQHWLKTTYRPQETATSAWEAHRRKRYLQQEVKRERKCQEISRRLGDPNGYRLGIYEYQEKSSLTWQPATANESWHRTAVRRVKYEARLMMRDLAPIKNFFWPPKEHKLESYTKLVYQRPIITGESLREIIDKSVDGNRTPLSELFRIYIGVLRALKQFRDHSGYSIIGHVHPDNIYWDTNTGVAYIDSMALASKKPISAKDYGRLDVQTAYTPAEVFSGLAYDADSDVCSLGYIFAELAGAKNVVADRLDAEGKLIESAMKSNAVNLDGLLEGYDAEDADSRAIDFQDLIAEYIKQGIKGMIGGERISTKKFPKDMAGGTLIEKQGFQATDRAERFSLQRCGRYFGMYNGAMMHDTTSKEIKLKLQQFEQQLQQGLMPMNAEFTVEFARWNDKKKAYLESRAKLQSAEKSLQAAFTLASNLRGSKLIKAAQELVVGGAIDETLLTTYIDKRASHAQIHKQFTTVDKPQYIHARNIFFGSKIKEIEHEKAQRKMRHFCTQLKTGLMQAEEIVTEAASAVSIELIQVQKDFQRELELGVQNTHIYTESKAELEAKEKALQDSFESKSDLQGSQLITAARKLLKRSTPATRKILERQIAEYVAQIKLHAPVLKNYRNNTRPRFINAERRLFKLRLKEAALYKVRKAYEDERIILTQLLDSDTEILLPEYLTAYNNAMFAGLYQPGDNGELVDIKIQLNNPHESRQDGKEYSVKDALADHRSIVTEKAHKIFKGVAGVVSNLMLSRIHKVAPKPIKELIVSIEKKMDEILFRTETHSYTAVVKSQAAVVTQTTTPAHNGHSDAKAIAKLAGRYAKVMQPAELKMPRQASEQRIAVTA